MGKSSKGSIFVIIFLLAISLFGYSPVLGQSLFAEASIFNEHRIVAYHYVSEYSSTDTTNKERKWNGGYVGARLVVIGLAVGLYSVADDAVHHAFDGIGSFTPAQNLTNFAVGGVGLGLIVLGIELANHYDEKHKVTVVSSGNQVGIAYHFR